MKEYPILFSAEMVRAILEGRKTQTRRPLRVQPDPEFATDWRPWVIDGERQYEGKRPLWICGPRDGICEQFGCPYGTEGDRLWVRETYIVESNCGLEDPSTYPPPFKDGRPVKWTEDPEWGAYWDQCHYAATDPKPELADDSDSEDGFANWRPSIFMPRWASRITLEIVKVRVEKVGAIAAGDILAEGIEDKLHQQSHAVLYKHWIDLWDSINAKRGYGWDVNPWCWVVEFRRV